MEPEDLPILATPAPGRVRGEWDPDVMYVVDDLVCVRHTDAVGSGQPVDTWHICVNKNTNRHPEESANSAYWQQSPWVNVTEEYTQPEYRYQRVHSINPEMIDEYILGKGVPSWYYFDMLGFFGTRTKFQNVVDLLTTMRGTILGVRSFLNLVNLDASLNRLAPEEVYNFPGENEELKHTDLSRESDWLNYMKSKGYWIPSIDDCSLSVKLARYWNDYTDYALDDLVYYNIITGGEYTGCGLYKALRPIAAGGSGGPAPSGTRASTDAWEWVCGYAVKPMAALQMPSETDNSRYELVIGQLAGRESELIDGKIMIVKPEWQQLFSCYLSRLIDFLIPAWIRIEGGMYLLDRRSIDGARHASSVNAMYKPAFEGIEPHTLTVLPHIEDMGKMVSETDVVGIDAHGSEFELLYAYYNYMGVLMGYYDEQYLSETELDRLILSGQIKGYYWHEPYMPEEYENARTLKVRVPAFQKIKLKSTLDDGSEAESKGHHFWRWSLLNSYHYLPHFRYGEPPPPPPCVPPVIESVEFLSDTMRLIPYGDGRIAFSAYPYNSNDDDPSLDLGDLTLKFTSSGSVKGFEIERKKKRHLDDEFEPVVSGGESSGAFPVLDLNENLAGSPPYIQLGSSTMSPTFRLKLNSDCGVDVKEFDVGFDLYIPRYEFAISATTMSCEDDGDVTLSWAVDFLPTVSSQVDIEVLNPKAVLAPQIEIPSPFTIPSNGATVYVGLRKSYYEPYLLDPDKDLATGYQFYYEYTPGFYNTRAVEQCFVGAPELATAGCPAYKSEFSAYASYTTGDIVWSMSQYNLYVAIINNPTIPDIYDSDGTTTGWRYIHVVAKLTAPLNGAQRDPETERIGVDYPRYLTRFTTMAADVGASGEAYPADSRSKAFRKMAYIDGVSVGACGGYGELATASYRLKIHGSDFWDAFNISPVSVTWNPGGA